MEIIEFDNNMIELVNLFAKNFSDDEETKVGCCIIRDNDLISFGYTALPNSCTKIKERISKPEKYKWMVHAEEYAITYAAKNGFRLDESIMYLNWFPCAKCAGLIVNSGIKMIYCQKNSINENSKYFEEFKISLEKLEEGGVEIKYLDYDIDR